MDTQPHIPVIVITGFLGSGKTTFLNHLLRSDWGRGQTIALIINEFGTLNVDGALVDGGGRPLYEINRGSLFCACTKMEVWKILTTLTRTPPDLVIIEATGVAVPTEFSSLIDSPLLAGRFSTQAIVGLVDAHHFLTIAPNMRAARQQVMAADGLIINKVDLADSADLDALPGVLAKLNPRAPRITARNAAVDPRWVMSLEHHSVDNAPAQAPPEAIFTVTVEVDGGGDQKAFDTWLDTYADHILRLKGTADFGDGLVFVERAGRDMVYTRHLPNRALSEKGRTAICVIGTGVPKERLEADLKSVFLV
ncbi:MAG: GTP-binding protein [Lentisphaeria bacterium]|nr:GTP-binding protein [Lentisphaeria bacterium]